MKELHTDIVNVLGVDVCNLKPERGVALSLEAMHTHELNIVYFMSAAGSLYCQETPWAMDLVNSFSMVFPGDRHTLMAVKHRAPRGENSLGEFAADYIEGFLFRMQREMRHLFIVTLTQEALTSFSDYLARRYPDIKVDGMAYADRGKDGADMLVNEINAMIPDALLLLIPPDLQLGLLKDYETMINAGLCICMDSMQPFFLREIRTVPGWVRFFHLESFYHWLHKEEKLESSIRRSLFRKKITEDTMSDDNE